jgi:hypothetical protein
MHKKSPDIKFENVSITSVIVRSLSDEAIQSADTKQCPLAGATGIGVIDKECLKERVQFRDNQVVNNTVPKICRKDFTFDGFINDKGNRFSWAIGSLIDLSLKRY